MKKILTLVIAFFILYSCSDDNSKINFKESRIIEKEGATIDIYYPSALGKSDKAANINSAINTAIATELSFTDEIKDNDLYDAISTFKKEYKLFKNDFPESEQKWEAIVEGEIIYQSEYLISISLSTYIDTGGAHGNSNIYFLNFNPENGEELSTKDLITDIKGFTELTKEHFEIFLVNDKSNLNVEDSFYGDDFKLPSTIGFSDNGVIILYNTYEIAAYRYGITEFEIPWEKASKFINRH